MWGVGTGDAVKDADEGRGTWREWKPIGMKGRGLGRHAGVAADSTIDLKLGPLIELHETLNTGDLFSIFLHVYHTIGEQYNNLKLTHELLSPDPLVCIEVR